MSSVDRIFQIMEDRKLTSAFVSKQTGISAGNFTDWKKGNTPRASTIDKIGDYLGVSSDYLLGRSDDPVAQKNVQNGYVIQGLSKEEFDEITSYLDYLRSKK